MPDFKRYDVVVYHEVLAENGGQAQSAVNHKLGRGCSVGFAVERYDNMNEGYAQDLDQLLGVMDDLRVELHRSDSTQARRVYLADCLRNLLEGIKMWED